jgi:hypothetical protein
MIKKLDTNLSGFQMHPVFHCPVFRRLLYSIFWAKIPCTSHVRILGKRGKNAVKPLAVKTSKSIEEPKKDG